MPKKQNDLLLIEAHKINYRLRSTFFYRRLHEYHTFEFPAIIKELIPHSDNFNWDDYQKWGISQSAFGLIQKSGLELIQVFSHTRLLRENPKLVAYYRNVAVLSQKATKYLIQLDPSKYEDGNKTELSENYALKFSKLFNEHISLIIESAFEKIEEIELHGILFASTGSQIDGSWRNAIGEEAEQAVQRLLVQEAIRRKLLHAFIKKDDNSIITLKDEKSEKLLKNIKGCKGIMLTNQRSILFSSEPDISILDKNGETLLVIEIKGGIDPAGALERYGAAKKSLEESKRQNRKVKTCIVASCITEEVKVRMKRDRAISKYINLTEVMTKSNKKENFFKYVFDIIEQ